MQAWNLFSVAITSTTDGDDHRDEVVASFAGCDRSAVVRDLLDV